MKNVYTPRISFEGSQFARAKRAAQLLITKQRLTIWIIGTLLFASRGGWLMYSTNAISAIMGGFFFMVLSAICAFMTVCEVLDLMGDV